MGLYKRYDNLDLLKVIAIVFVLIYHVYARSANLNNVTGSFNCYNYFLKSILGTCVPVFFFVNGALLLNKRAVDI